MRVDGLNKLRAKLNKLAKQAKESAGVVVVGFTQRYAIHVHENMDAYHKVGQAKYLEAPARRLQGELGKIVEEEVLKGRSIKKGLIIAGLRLQREAQLLTPVDTSALKASAYTAYEEDNEAAAAAAFARSEQVRTSMLGAREAKKKKVAERAKKKKAGKKK
jgi:hypothetical protein